MLSYTRRKNNSNFAFSLIKIRALKYSFTDPLTTIGLKSYILKPGFIYRIKYKVIYDGLFTTSQYLQ